MNLHGGKSTWLNFHAAASPRSVCLILSSVAILVIGLALLSAGSVPLSAQSTLATEKYVTRLQPVLQRIIREESIVGLAIGIVEDGAVTYSAGFGVTTLREPARPVSAQTLFHMASVTKPFVATGILQLVEKGKVGLDERVSKYVPYFRLKDPRSLTITVRQMLTHTSGMPDVESYYWDRPEYDDDSLERYVRSLHDKELGSAPGSKYAYSNMAFEVLGDLIAKVSGISFEDYVEAHILKPLGMRSSTLLFRNADRAKLADGHARAKSGPVTPVEHYPYNRAHTPSSNMHSNVEDMARWMIANLNRGELDGQRILQHASYDLLWKPAADTDRRGLRVALSWFLTEARDGAWVVHGGRDDGFLTYIALAPERRIGVVLMTNTDHAPLARIREAVLAEIAR